MVAIAAAILTHSEAGNRPGLAAIQAASSAADVAKASTAALVGLGVTAVMLFLHLLICFCVKTKV
jgi:hypothetical protein